MSRWTTWLVLTVLAASAPAEGRAADGPALSEAEFKTLLRLARPAEAEPWDSIPWMVSVREARRLAAREGKPILCWSQNGHPLAGC
jgi:hypothetical protein